LVGQPWLRAGAAIPGTIVESGAVGPGLAAMLRHPATESAAAFGGAALGNTAMEGMHDMLQEGMPYLVKAGDKVLGWVSPSAQAAEGELPHLQWYTNKGDLKIGPTSEPAKIKALQTFLKGRNLYTGPIDGKWETGTATAAGAYGDSLHADWSA